MVDIEKPSKRRDSSKKSMLQMAELWRDEGIAVVKDKSDLSLTTAIVFLGIQIKYTALKLVRSTWIMWDHQICRQDIH